MVVAFGAVTISAAFALPCAGHDHDLHQDDVRAAPLALDSNSVASQLVLIHGVAFALSQTARDIVERTVAEAEQLLPRSHI